MTSKNDLENILSSVENTAFHFGSEDEPNSAETDASGSQQTTPATSQIGLDDTKLLVHNQHLMNDSPRAVESPPPSGLSIGTETAQKQHGHAEHTHPVESRSNSGIKDDIWLLHADEVVSLAQKQAPLVAPSDSYHTLAKKIIRNYMHYCWVTWTRCLWSLIVLPSSEH
jgi:hypothetical protein